MKNIKNIIACAILGISVLLLSACGDDKQEHSILSEPLMMEDLENQITWTSTVKDRVLCVEYATNRNSFEDRKPFCLKWMAKQYAGYLRKMERRIDEVGVYSKKLPFLPTKEEFIDPAVWKVIWDKYNQQWAKDLIVEQAEEKKEKEREEKEKKEHDAYCKEHRFGWGCF